jgi:hypothetical protein
MVFCSEEKFCLLLHFRGRIGTTSTAELSLLAPSMPQFFIYSFIYLREFKSPREIELLETLLLS